MFANIGPTERKLRILVGILLMVISSAVPMEDQMRMVSITMAILLLFPAALGFCPFKAVLLRKLS